MVVKVKSDPPVCIKLYSRLIPLVIQLRGDDVNVILALTEDGNVPPACILSVVN